MSVTSPSYLLQVTASDVDGIALVEVSTDNQATWLPLTFNPLTGFWERALTLVPGTNVLWLRATDAHPTAPLTSTPTSVTITYIASATITLTATVDATNGRVALRAVVGNDPQSTRVTITRVHPSGREIAVRGAELADLSGGIFSGGDYEQPIGVPVSYIARSYGAASTAVRLTSSAHVVTWQTLDDWLKDPFEPVANVKVSVESMAEYDYPTRTGIHDVLGRPAPITVGEIRESARGDLVLLTLSKDERDRLHYLTASGRPLLLQSTQESGVGNMYLALTGLKEARRTSLRDAPERRWTAGYVEVDPPVGGAPGTITTYQDVADQYSTYQQIVDGNTSYLDLIENLGHVEAFPILTWRGA